MPIVNGLQQQYGERVDFINLDHDKAETQETRYKFGIRGRSHYVLIDAEQNVVRQWFGVLREDQVTSEIQDALAEIGVTLN